MNRLSQSAIMEESEVREAKKWRRANALWFPATGSYHTQNSGRVNKRNINWGGAGWGNTRTRPGFFKQFPNPSQTRLFKFNLVPLGAGQDGYPKKPAPLPSLPTFHGLGYKNPCLYLWDFDEVCLTFHYHNYCTNYVLLKPFFVLI